MKKVVLIIVLLAAALLAGLYYYTADPNIVDEDYLETEKFRLLEKSIENEKNKIGSREALLHVVVRQMLAEPDKYQQDLPDHFDSHDLDSVMVPANKLSLDDFRITPPGFTNYSFYGWIIFQGNNYTGVLSLIKLPGVYKNIEVGLTTVRDSSIIDVVLIARYEKNPTEEITTNLYIKEDFSIKAVIEKARIYPVEQKNTVIYRYSISDDGVVETTVQSDGL